LQIQFLANSEPLIFIRLRLAATLAVGRWACRRIALSDQVAEATDSGRVSIELIFQGCHLA